jgi:hypothetical protein
MGLQFALMSSLLLIANYFVQITVIPASLASGELQGIPLLIQYNPNGIFISIEEIGFLLMSLSFLFLSLAFDQGTLIIKAISWIFRINFVLVALIYVIMSLYYGHELKDRFEVVIISLNWLVLIINGILSSLMFRKEIRAIKFVK